MKHSFNLNRIAGQVTGDKVAQTTFYHKLINAFKGADVLTPQEASDVLDVVKSQCDWAEELLKRFIPAGAVIKHPVKKTAAKKKAPAKTAIN